jgi:HAD superfamily hydrolase (TIGR01509 family)
VTSASSGRAPAVLFDIDGTLVDSNYLHVHAWQRAFHDVGVGVDAWRIHRCIGMDGSALITTLGGDQLDDTTSAELKKRHSDYYARTAALLRLLPGARALLHHVGQMGLQVVLATSAPQDELALLRTVLDSDDIVSAFTSSEDVATAKPEPDLVEVALQRAGVSAAHAVFVGDSIWDAQAATRAGVTCIGLLCGGIFRHELEQAGAARVYTDADDLRHNLSCSPIGELTWTTP